MATEAQRRALARWRAAHVVRMEIKPYIEEGAAIDAAAQAAGESRQGYILEAVHRRMAADGREYQGRRVGRDDAPEMAQATDGGTGTE